MTKKTSTKRALLSSVVSLLLCFSMLLGTTYAWFTDTVTSANNVIAAGNLDIELTHTNDKVTGATVTAETELFDSVELWEPGVMVWEKFTIKNAGNLALKYQFALNALEATVVDGISFANVLKVAVVDDTFTYTRENVEALDSWKSLASFTLDGELVKQDDTKTFGIIIWWQPSEIDNVFNMNNEKTGDVSVKVGIVLSATQMASEADGFDSSYDEGAIMEGWNVSTGAELQEAINQAAEEGGTVVIHKDIELDGPIVIPASAAAFSLRAAAVNEKTIVIDLNGKTIKGNWAKADGAVIKNEGILVITNGTISSTANNGGSAIMNTGILTVENVTLNGAPNADGNWPSYTVNNTGVMNITNSKITSYHGAVCSYEGGVLTLNNSEIDMAGIPGFTSHGIYTYDGGSVVVNGGTYANHATDQNSTGASVINGDVTVNGGTFSGRIENYYGNPVIKGGTFSVEPNAKFIAENYEVTQNGDGTYVVRFPQSSFDSLVSNIPENGIVELPAGVYTMPEPDLRGKTLTISGTKDTVIDLTAVDARDQFVTGATIVFDGVTLDFGKVNYMGLANTASLTYKNCQINGLQFLFGENVTFENCDLNSNGAEHCVWTYGAKNVTFTGCDFTYSDRCVNCYSDNDVDGGKQTVKFTGCTFATENESSNGAVEINSTYISNGIDVVMNDCAAPDHGEMVYISEYDTSAGAKTTMTVDGKDIYVALVGNKWANAESDAAVLKAALTSDKKNIIVVLLEDVEGNFGHSSELGGANTETITINGNGHKLTLTKDYMPGFWLANDAGKLTINDATITAVRESGTWDVYDINFDNDTELNNVTFEQAVSLSGAGDTYVLNNVSISETHDYYALWISADGADVTIDGLTVNSAGRGIKIDEEYQNENVAKVTLKVSNATFNTAKKAAIMVKSAAGAEITLLDKVDISNVAVDPVHAVWVDEDAAAYANLVSVTGGKVAVEGTVKIIKDADDLFAFAKDVNENEKTYTNMTVVLAADIDLENKLWTPIGQTGNTTFAGNFDGQGYTIKNLNVDSSAQTGAHYSSGLFGWIEIHSSVYTVIENLNIETATIVGNHNCGTIVGYATGSVEIKNCNVTKATVSCNVANDDANGDKAGVIAGNITAKPETKVTNCTASDSTVTAGRDAGQLVGAGNTENVTGTATNVEVTANGQGTGANINKALVGRNL